MMYKLPYIFSFANESVKQAVIFCFRYQIVGLLQILALVMDSNCLHLSHRVFNG